MYSKIPNTSQRNLHQSSPNNNIAGRTNQPRLGARVPAIYGTVQSTPDLLSNYFVYEANKQVEYSYLCVGEGYYDIVVRDASGCSATWPTVVELTEPNEISFEFSVKNVTTCYGDNTGRISIYNGIKLLPSYS